MRGSPPGPPARSASSGPARGHPVEPGDAADRVERDIRRPIPYRRAIRAWPSSWSTTQPKTAAITTSEKASPPCIRTNRGRIRKVGWRNKSIPGEPTEFPGSSRHQRQILSGVDRNRPTPYLTSPGQTRNVRAESARRSPRRGPSDAIARPPTRLVAPQRPRGPAARLRDHVGDARHWPCSSPSR